MLRDRPYQAGAVKQALTSWRAGLRRVLLVAPTGSGKTHMGCRVVQHAVSRGYPVLWVAHRQELVTQSQERLEAHLEVPVGIVASGFRANRKALVQVASVQTLHARGSRPPARLVVIDECHHYRARTYQDVVEHYDRTPWLGLTATGERSDGKPLGNVFDSIVQAAHYSELIEQQYLVPCRVLRPESPVTSGLAQDPVAAYYKHTPNEQAFCFTATKEKAEEYAVKFTQAGYPAAPITDDTPDVSRAQRLERFKRGELRVLTNCYTLTEGVDVPQASVAILARGCSHSTPYLQMVGRVLRTYPGKEYSTLIDLPGVSHELGLPTEDRIYSLQQGAVRREGPGGLSLCIQCGWTYQGSSPKCPKCGAQRQIERRSPLRIYNRELQAVYARERTPEHAKQAEFDRLLSVCKERGFNQYWAIKQYRELFGHSPPAAALSAIGVDQKRDTYQKLLEKARTRGVSTGWAKHAYKATYGCWPDRAWE